MNLELDIADELDLFKMQLESAIQLLYLATDECPEDNKCLTALIHSTLELLANENGIGRVEKMIRRNDYYRVEFKF